MATDADGEALFNAGIVYAPDYAINAGGLTNIYHESDRVQGGYSKARAFDHVAGIAQTISMILDRSKAEKLPPHLIADRVAEERFRK